jgi:glycosyltransferase involved in cell wall biosynthesis
VQHLIAALSAVPDAQLLVAGEGEMLPELQAQAARHEVEGRVRFLGLVPRDRLTTYMQAVDYVALYSGYEGLSHTLLEALRVGTPVIASDKGGNPEVITHDVNGLLVPYVDLDALKAALRTAFTPGKRDQLAAKTPLGLERFDFDRMLAQTTAVLRGSV